MKLSPVPLFGLLSILSVVKTSAQQTASTIPAAGGNAISAGGSVSYSVGQAVYTSNTNGTAFVNEGVQSVIVNLVLPVTLIDFSGTCTGQQVLMSWTTASEVNNKNFTVERSSDGSIWTALGTVGGAGTSTSSNHYNFTDTKPTATAAYYRLKQTDLDGVSEYSAVVYVKSCNGSTPSISLYPNPTAHGIYLNSTAFAGIEYKLYDLNGRLLKEGKMKQAATYIELQGAGRSTYLLKITQNNLPLETFKILKN